MEERKWLKMAKKWQKTHKNIKKYRARLRISKKSSTFARNFEIKTFNNYNKWKKTTKLLKMITSFR